MKKNVRVVTVATKHNCLQITGSFMSLFPERGYCLVVYHACLHAVQLLSTRSFVAMVAT